VAREHNAICASIQVHNAGMQRDDLRLLIIVMGKRRFVAALFEGHGRSKLDL
jgi:hypothetical protein